MNCPLSGRRVLKVDERGKRKETKISGKSI
jgi:hypothetical protein